jgi:hypothetical protein
MLLTGAGSGFILLATPSTKLSREQRIRLFFFVLSLHSAHLRHEARVTGHGAEYQPCNASAILGGIPSRCPSLAAADRNNHAAKGFGTIAGPYQIAAYRASGTGNLTPSSTHSNMPRTLGGDATDDGMAPSAKLLAARGTEELHVFHFNGASPVAHYTGLVTSGEVDQMFWDHANHLQAMGKSAGKLYVLAVTPASARPAPGSPYSIAGMRKI